MQPLSSTFINHPAASAHDSQSVTYIRLRRMSHLRIIAQGSFNGGLAEMLRGGFMENDFCVNGSDGGRNKPPLREVTVNESFLNS